MGSNSSCSSISYVFGLQNIWLEWRFLEVSQVAETKNKTGKISVVKKFVVMRRPRTILMTFFKNLLLLSCSMAYCVCIWIPSIGLGSGYFLYFGCRETVSVKISI